MSISTSRSKGWLNRISLALLGELRDRDDVVRLLRDAYDRNFLDTDAFTMIEGVLQVSEMQVRDIMVPRSQMKVVDIDASIQEMLPVIIDSAHSRFPVIADSRDEVVGVLLAKDLLRYFVEGNKQEFNIEDILRPSVIVPESKRLNILLNEFRNNRNHMAIIVDEYGGVAGLVTIEDVLEQIVGDITDEHDIEEDQYISTFLREGFHIVKALTPIEDFNEYFNSDFSDAEFDTVGGLLTSCFARVPKRGEQIELGGFLFEILRADSRRIHLLKVVTNT